ncbi:hypothetical protein DIE08_32425 [Burkholderia sp. Bp9004]|nr:hypothetical protein DIE08_32425 [Burkholderia sp. Bp9004]
MMGSVLWREGGPSVGCNIVRRYALETVSEQGFGIGEKVAHAVLAGSTMPLDIAGLPGETGSGQPGETCPWLAH